MVNDPMVRTQVYINPHLKKGAKQAAAEDGLTMAEIIRQALALFLAQRLSASKQTASNQ